VRAETSPARVDTEEARPQSDDLPQRWSVGRPELRPDLKFHARGPGKYFLSRVLARETSATTQRSFQWRDRKTPGQLLDVHPGDGPGDDQPLDLTRTLEDGVGLIGPSGR
jgi:hypothetical protein